MMYTWQSERYVGVWKEKNNKEEYKSDKKGHKKVM